MATDNTDGCLYGGESGRAAHQGLWKNYRDRPIAMLERAIKSLEQCIAEHRAKIARPHDFLRPDVPEIQVEHLVKVKWPQEIDTFKAQSRC